MIPTPNYRWKCKICGKELTTCQSEEFPQSTAVSPKCPKCGGEMEGTPIVCRGPFPENPFKKD